MSKINGEKSIKDKLENIKKKIENSHSNITINEFLDQFEEIMLNELKEEDLILIKDFFKSGYVKKIKLLFISEENDKEILMRKLKELEEKIETLEIEISQQKSINEIQKKNISDLEKQRIEQESINQSQKKRISDLDMQDEAQKKRITDLEKKNIEQESINQSQKKRILDLEMQDEAEKNRITDLEKQRIEQESINQSQKKLISDLEMQDEAQKKRITDLEKKNIEQESINLSQKQEISDLKKKNESQGKQIELLVKDIKSIKEESRKYKKNLEEMILNSVHKGQDEIEKENALKKIKERDNYKAILYAILISMGISFEEIYLNLNDKFQKNIPNIKQEFIRIALDSQYNLYNSDDIAHESSTNNILKKLFPKYSGLSKLFTDQILNGTKEVIKNLPLFKLGVIKDPEFKVKMDNITDLIRNTFNK